MSLNSFLLHSHGVISFLLLEDMYNKKDGDHIEVEKVCVWELSRQNGLISDGCQI